MSGPITSDGDSMTAEDILNAIFPKLNTQAPPPQTAGARDDPNSGGEIVSVFFNIRDQIKLYHWQTKSFAEHKGVDEIVQKLDENIDKFIEIYMGRHGRPYVKETLEVKNLTAVSIREFIDETVTWLTEKLPSMIKKTDTDLLNIRDEMLGDLNQVKYLLTLT
jgi:hypothetical protein